jgi:hypothetical protein
MWSWRRILSHALHEKNHHSCSMHALCVIHELCRYMTRLFSCPMVPEKLWTSTSADFTPITWCPAQLSCVFYKIVTRSARPTPCRQVLPTLISQTLDSHYGFLTSAVEHCVHPGLRADRRRHLRLDCSNSVLCQCQARRSFKGFTRLLAKCGK